jgi:hypothetical protein
MFWGIMNTRGNNTKPNRNIALIILAFAIAEILLHLCVNAFGGYGYFRDEHLLHSLQQASCCRLC